ncbi:hypothetical protein HanRHA438_Chr11g0512361 [Helianthus annuus]|uniref:Uncharacterized protein n=1 Tax=Helianthus annuus TaxID=4232 RepID=A0A9K3HQB0_HELAN|nr:hypothetical protein HanXRQr2_Chr11g0499631 [Helianthus annuus]KAJ0689991.1 hypothetical protein HanOQP8_Chr11g0412691 [Helianthus annuus]KAJ0871437.1 hypothetical protein HanRHA438_Chr11g0512361 [Helianthus annuus]KAJ0875845.1 hypothetical protein HanPSC8_Chr11g0481371 [Helianthus annuus]
MSRLIARHCHPHFYVLSFVIFKFSNSSQTRPDLRYVHIMYICVDPWRAKVKVH